MNSKRGFLLDRPKKIALARIITDLIEADFIVEEQELNFYEVFITQEVQITVPMLVEAKKTDIAKAVSILKELDVDKRKVIVAGLKELALSDGTCVPLEAIQILALEQALEHDAFVYSVPASEIGIENMTAIYIENDSNNGISKTIEQNYSSISDEFLKAGFEFVYIPYVVRDYQLMNEEYLRKVIRYMIPSVSPGKLETISHNLQNMTTSAFCRDILFKKHGIPISDSGPSLLIKINESSLIYPDERDDSERTSYANFLLVRLTDDLLYEIHTLLDAFHNMVSCPIVAKHAPEEQKFLYYGFHRSLFDLIAYGHEQKEYKLIVDVSTPNANISLTPIDGTAELISIKLNPQETTLLTMIIKKSIDGKGLDWRDEPPCNIKEELLEEYNRIYRRIGKGRTARVYKDRIQVHNIKNRFLAHKNAVANIDLFVPVHVKDGIFSYYIVKAPIDLIIIREPSE